VSLSCPKSYIRPESIAWIEEYQVQELFGRPDVSSLPARTVDAFCVLKEQIEAERRNAQQRNR
jgi:hypothetical protein